MKPELNGKAMPEIRQFFDAYFQAWLDRDPLKVAGFYRAPLTIVRAGRPFVLETREAILANAQQDVARWHPDAQGIDVTTQLTAPGPERCAVVHLRYGRWSVRLPNATMVKDPECTYVLAKADDQWQIVLIAADWRPVPA